MASSPVEDGQRTDVDADMSRSSWAFFFWIAFFPALALILELSDDASASRNLNSIPAAIGYLAVFGLAFLVVMFLVVWIIGGWTRTRAVSIAGLLLGMPLSILVFAHFESSRHAKGPEQWQRSEIHAGSWPRGATNTAHDVPIEKERMVVDSRSPGSNTRNPATAGFIEAG
ncbi:hypothetical protein [Variovorax boronicumulans]